MHVRIMMLKVQVGKVRVCVFTEREREREEGGWGWGRLGQQKGQKIFMQSCSTQYEASMTVIADF